MTLSFPSEAQPAGTEGWSERVLSACGEGGRTIMIRNERTCSAVHPPSVAASYTDAAVHWPLLSASWSACTTSARRFGSSYVRAKTSSALRTGSESWSGVQSVSV